MKHLLIAALCGSALLFCNIPGANAASKIFDVASLKISQMGDLEMSCNEISQEVSNMEEIIFYAEQLKNDSEMTATGINVGKAVGSYLVGSLAGGIGILAAGYIANAAATDRTENATDLQNAARQRRSFMAGVYNAKGCIGPLDLASIEPAAGQENLKPQYEPDHNAQKRYND